jgi:hypothetical protein
MQSRKWFYLLAANDTTHIADVKLSGVEVVLRTSLAVGLGRGGCGVDVTVSGAGAILYLSLH